MHSHLATPPPRLTDVRPDLPKDFDRVIARAMAKSRDDRFESASDLLNAAHASVLGRRAPVTQPVVERVVEPETPSAEPASQAPPPAVPEPAEPAPSVVEPVAAASAPPSVEPPPRPPPSSPPPPTGPGSGAAVPAPAAPPRRGPPSWIVTALLVAGAAAAAALVAYFVARDDSPNTSAATPTTEVAAPTSLDALVPAQLWKDCTVQALPATGAEQTAVCTQSDDLAVQSPPDRWEISIYPDASALDAAYRSERDSAGVEEGGRCDGTRWGGSGAWVHPGNPPKPGGERFCYFDGDDAVMVWTHARLGQPNHRDMLAIAREGGTDHAGLFSWWRFWHHRIGKAGA